MTALRSPALTTPSISTFTSRRLATPAAAAPKLRDSCHACASSKLKCYKEKPTCSRCAKRGLVCEYVAAKRASRKHDRRLRIHNNSELPPNTAATMKTTQPLTSVSSWFALDSAILNTDSMPSPCLTYPSPRQPTSSVSSNFFSNLLSPVENPGSPAFPDLVTDLDDFCVSPISFSVPEMPDTEILGSAPFFSTTAVNNSSSKDPATLFDAFPMSEDTVSELFTLSNSRSPPNNQTSHTGDQLGCSDSRPNNPSCFCLFRALSLMKQLFPGPTTVWKTSATLGLDKSTTNPPTVQAVIAKNEHTIEAVGTMLECACSQDGYLLVLVSLIVFKVLGWYAAAALTTPSSGDDNHSAQSLHSSQSAHLSRPEQVLLDPVEFGSYCLDGENSARMAAQLVLGELHRVQRLVNQLSPKLKMQAAKDNGLADKSTPATSKNVDSETTLSLSTVILSQLELDLRKRLKALSLGIMESLRRE